MVDTKNSTNSETLLHSLILLLEEKSKGEYTKFACNDLLHVADAARVDLNEIAKNKDALKNSLRKACEIFLLNFDGFFFQLTTHLAKYVKQNDGDKFIEKMTPFAEQAEKDVVMFEAVCQISSKNQNVLLKKLY